MVQLNNGKKSIIFGLIGIILFSISIPLGSYILLYGVPPVFGIIALIYGIIGLKKDENKRIALIGLTLGILSIYSFPLFYWVATSLRLFS